MARGKKGTAWIEQIFEAGQVQEGNVVRRSISSVMQQTSLQTLIAAVKARGFHMALIGTQVVIICNAHGGLNVVC